MNLLKGNIVNMVGDLNAKVGSNNTLLGTGKTWIHNSGKLAHFCSFGHLFIDDTLLENTLCLVG